jgi:NADH:ubiquinone oxidoreductase subunit 5 (subunit L)/multisubunit Na+/H+ antiporter MnhA subunit
VPLFVLAVLSVVGGLVGPPLMEGGHPFARWLAPVFASGAHEGGHAAAHEVPVATEWMLIGLSVLVAVAGIAFAFRAYLWSPATATRLRERLSGVHRTLLNKYWVDELYELTVVRPIYSAPRRSGASGTRRSWTVWSTASASRWRVSRPCCACSRPASSAPTRCSSRWVWSPCSSTS